VPLATNQGFKSIVPSTKVEHRFLFYTLTSSKAAFIRLAAGSTFLEFSKAALETFVINVPSRDEQEAIADVLDAAFDELELSSEMITKLKRQKCGLMEKLLSGAWRLAGLADTTPAKVLAAG
jgi:type I restriction enzyme S subunit